MGDSLTFYYQDSDQWSGILKSMLATDSQPVPVQVTVAESSSVSCADNTVTVTIKPAAPIRAGTTLSIKGINAKPMGAEGANLAVEHQMHWTTTPFKAYPGTQIGADSYIDVFAGASHTALHLTGTLQ